MGFFDKIRSGRLFFGKKQPLLLVQFTFRGKKYIIEEFDLEFGNQGSYKNSSSGGPVCITLTMSDIPDDNINSWVMNSYQLHDGEFRFLMNDGMIKEGAQLQIIFKEAYCVNYRKVMNPTGAGVLTTLMISPRYIRVGNEEYENAW